jgi:hypothetical protein
MKNDNIAPPPLAIVRLEPGHVLIRQAPLLERLGSARYQAESGQWLGSVSAAFAPHSLLERRVRREQVHVLERRGLIEYLVRRERPGHGTFPPNSAG